jgi:uncharacterized protein YjbI with pentapeptide repeats
MNPTSPAKPATIDITKNYEDKEQPNKVNRVKNSIGLHFEYEGKLDKEVAEEMLKSLHSVMVDELGVGHTEFLKVVGDIRWNQEETLAEKSIVKSIAKLIEENKLGEQATFQSTGTPSVTCKIQSLGNKAVWEFGQITYEFYKDNNGGEIFKYSKTFSLTNKGDALTFPAINGEDQENKRNLDLCCAVLPNAQFRNVCSLNLCDANLENSTLINIDFSLSDCKKVNLTSATIIGQCAGANFQYAKLSYVNAREVNFKKADLSDADLSSSDLSDSNFSGADLSRANLSHSNFSHADLSGANLSGANLSGCNLLGAYLEDANLTGADLSGTNLNDTNFVGANLSGANLCEATLIYADLSNAILTNARFDYAILNNASFKESNLIDAIIVNAHVNERTLLPEKFPVPSFHPEDIVDRDSIWFFSEKNPFAKSMTAIAKRLKVNFFSLPTGKDIWLRDIFYKAKVGDAGEKMEVYRAPQYSEERNYSREGSAMKNHRFSYVQTHNVLRGIRGEVKDAPIKNVRIIGNFTQLPKCVIQLPHHGSCFIEGGNIFIAAGKDGKRQCFIGNDSIVYHKNKPGNIDIEKQYEQHKESIDRSYPDISDIEKRTILWTNRKIIKREIMAILKVEKLIVIPQIYFHIDLQMAYLGENTFMVHSFDESLQFLGENAEVLIKKIGNEKYQELYSVNVKLAADLEGNVDITERRLEKAGMTVVKCCATLFVGDEEADNIIDQRGVIRGKFMSSFINGITVVGADGKRHFVTTGAPDDMDLHQEYLQDLLSKKCDVVLECIDIDPGTGFDSGMSFLEKQEGAIRCLSNTNLINVINHNHQEEKKTLEEIVLDS